MSSICLEYYNEIHKPGFHLENCPRGGVGGNWRYLDFKGGGGGGGGGRVCLNVCVCRGFI